MNILISKTAKLKWNSFIKKIYIELGYKFTKMGDEFEVKVEHLSKGSNAIVQWKCDDCNEPIYGTYYEYNKYLKEDGSIHCKKCATKERIENGRKTKLKNSISMGQWAIDNNLFHYIDLEKNKEEGIDVFSIGYGSKTKIWFKCLDTDYHGSYKMSCKHFKNGQRCPYCSSIKIHPLDSLAQSIINEYGLDFFNKVWNWEKNNELGINPWEIFPQSNIEVWWNCLDENKNHESYLRSCNNSYTYKYRCPKCYEPPKGENHPCWNPNISQEEREMKRSKFPGYYEFVKEVMQRDYYMCQITGKKGNIIVHHLNGYNWDKENRLNPDNAITLCEEVHRLFHNIYGYGDNTVEQFEEFLIKIEYGIINISNIK